MFDSVTLASRGTANVLVLAQFKGEKLDANSKKLDPSGAGADASGRAEATGELGSIVQAFPGNGHERVFIVGLGNKDCFDPARLRTAAGSIARALSKTKAASADIAVHAALSKLPKSAKVDLHACGSAMGEGLGIASWNYDILRGSATTPKDRTKLAIHCNDAKFRGGLARGLGLSEGTNIARTLSQTPPNIATPAWIASEAKKMARKTGLKCTVVQGKALETEKLTGLIEVGKASEHKPCMIRLEYTPARGKTKDPIVLVGKTMTYDSGGLSIKVGGGMRGMKRDKDGGCAVFGAMHSIATVIKPNRPVVALLMCAENSISDEAYRPDDVIEFRNGVTVEITNTDAEGRLVLADGLCWACDKESPAAILDIATLTGGVVVALGSTYAGMWCDDDDFRAILDDAGDASDERVWRLPHHAEYRQLMRSPVADILNSAPVRAAHPVQGAAFLSYFVEDGIPWAHVDIAGTHSTDKDSGPFISGPTGFGARLISEMVERF